MIKGTVTVFTFSRMDTEYSNDKQQGNAKFIYTYGNSDYSEYADRKKI